MHVCKYERMYERMYERIYEHMYMYNHKNMSDLYMYIDVCVHYIWMFSELYCNMQDIFPIHE